MPTPGGPAAAPPPCGARTRRWPTGRSGPCRRCAASEVEGVQGLAPAGRPESLRPVRTRRSSRDSCSRWQTSAGAGADSSLTARSSSSGRLWGDPLQAELRQQGRGWRPRFRLPGQGLLAPASPRTSWGRSLNSTMVTASPLCSPTLLLPSGVVCRHRALDHDSFQALRPHPEKYLLAQDLSRMRQGQILRYTRGRRKALG